MGLHLTLTVDFNNIIPGDHLTQASMRLGNLLQPSSLPINAKQTLLSDTLKQVLEEHLPTATSGKICSANLGSRAKPGIPPPPVFKAHKARFVRHIPISPSAYYCSSNILYCLSTLVYSLPRPIFRTQ